MRELPDELPLAALAPLAATVSSANASARTRNPRRTPTLGTGWGFWCPGGLGDLGI